MNTNTYKFIPSGVASLLTVCQKRHPEVYESIKRYFDIYLISFGSEIVPLRQFMEDKRYRLTRDDFIKALEKIDEKFEEQVNKIDDRSKLYIDSGGFQLSFKGFLDFIYRDYPVKYYPAIDKISNHPKVDTVFYLDIPESRDDTYKTFREDNMFSFNIYMDYLRNKQNPFNDKMAFIIQFNSPERLELWNYFLDNVVSYKPKKYAVGGLVASRASLYLRHPVVHWSTGLLMLLNKMVEHNSLYGDFHFHLLGVTTSYYIISSFIIMEYLSHKTGFRYDVTYDGKSVIDKFVRGRYLICYDKKNKMLTEASALSRDLKKKLYNGMTNEETILYWINDFLEDIGSKVRFNEVYDKQRDTIPNSLISAVVAYESYVLNDMLQKDYLPFIKANIDKIERRNKGFLISIYEKILERGSRDTVARLIKQTIRTLDYIDRILDGEKVDLYHIFYQNDKLDKLCLK